MLEDSFTEVYTKFKLHRYREIFARARNGLTAVEAFCMEVIHALKEPTINEFASFAQISSPNAAYKVNSLIQKGYVEKVQSQEDRREYHLRPTRKYMEEYDVGSSYVRQVLRRVRTRLSEEDLLELDRMLEVVGQELMPEVTLK